MATARPDEILEFWFAGASRKQWWGGDAAFDQEVPDRFGETTRAARADELDMWNVTPDGALALVIALDQFPRNIYRNTPDSFSSDAKALAITRAATSRGDDRRVVPQERQVFFYLPYQHCEDLATQDEGVALTERWVESLPESERAGSAIYPTFAKKHRDVIERFGRFPHRNEFLGRVSTPKEEGFLRDPGSPF